MLGQGPRDPKIKITHLDDQCIKFTLSDTDQSIANSLRRIMISEVPTLAIDYITIEENTSVLFDEFLAHRVGLLPINSNGVDNYSYQRDCSCTDGDGCPFCTVRYVLDVTNYEDVTRDVTHLDINIADMDEVMNHNREKSMWALPVPRNDDSLSPTEFAKHSGIPIIKLKKNQTIKMDMVANKGVGKSHAKYSPVATCVFAYEPDVRLDAGEERKMSFEDKRMIVNSCPTKVFDIDDGDKLFITNSSACLNCDQCVDKAKAMGVPRLLRVDQRQDMFHFTVETVGSRRPQDIVKSAIKVLIEKFTDLEKSIDEIDDSKIEDFEVN